MQIEVRNEQTPDDAFVVVSSMLNLPVSLHWKKAACRTHVTLATSSSSQSKLYNCTSCEQVR